MTHTSELALDLVFYGLMLLAVVASWLSTKAERRRGALFAYFMSELERMRGQDTSDAEWIQLIERVLGLSDLAVGELDAQHPDE